MKEGMRSLQLDLGKYDSYKIENRYLKQYDPILEPFLEKKIVLLELGVHKGGPPLLWRDYFPQATIAGIDISLPKGFQPNGSSFWLADYLNTPQFRDF